MRKVNYWKTLLVVLCTGCIFAACGDDDDENPFTGVDNNFLSFSLESNENVWKATIIDNEITVTVPRVNECRINIFLFDYLSFLYVVSHLLSFYLKSGQSSRC